MLIFLYSVQIILCLILIALITTSDKDEGGLGGAIGGASSGGGSSRYKPGYEERMDQVTKYIAWGFLIFSLLIAWAHPSM